MNAAYWLARLVSFIPLFRFFSQPSSPLFSLQSKWGSLADCGGRDIRLDHMAYVMAFGCVCGLTLGACFVLLASRRFSLAARVLVYSLLFAVVLAC